jgi:DNA-binding CsgD family transcriptional regulator
VVNRTQKRTAERSRRKEISAVSRRAWRLTPAEARCVTALALGQNPREIAAVRAVSIHTVRTQLKRAMTKADAHTQSALVASVYSIVR